MAIPKMTLRVNLLGNNGAYIKLVQVTDIYTKSLFLSKTGITIFTPNNWMVMVGGKFSINKRTKTLVIPNDQQKNSDDTLYFKGDENRKEILREINNTLLEWSSDKFFKDKKVFDDNPHIKYYGDLWVIF